MLSKFLCCALVPATRCTAARLAARQTKHIAHIQPNVQAFNSSRFYSDEKRRKMYENFYNSKSGDKSSQSAMYYSMSLVVICVGLSYAAVPLYRIFCQSTGFGGTISDGHDADKVETMERIADRVLTIQFNADKATSMRWNFKPLQYEIKVVPGETALAFYTAVNPTDVPVIGVSTYNVIPFEAAQYFNKIQCFCFEAQQLNPREEVDMPVFFYIDPEFADDPRMEFVDTIVLSYKFFESKDGVNIPIPSYAKKHK